MLTACGLFMAFWQAETMAQDQEKVSVVNLSSSEGPVFMDTLVIRLGAGGKVMIIGEGFRNMTAYRQADSLKTLFISDVEEARRSGMLPRDAQKVFYFVHAGGKRRIKAENPDYTSQSVDVGYEIMRLDHGLPKYEYFIYDLGSGFRMNIYLPDPDSLTQVLGSVSLNDAIRYASGHEEANLKRSYKVQLGEENNRFSFESRVQGHYGILEMGPCFGAGLIGNTFSPIIGIDMWLRLTDKYTVPKYRAGLSYNTSAIVNTRGGEIRSVHLIRSYEARFSYNFASNHTLTSGWVGLKAGFVTSSLSSFNKTYKIGIMSSGKGDFTYSFEFIGDTYGVSIMKSF